MQKFVGLDIAVVLLCGSLHEEDIRDCLPSVARPGVVRECRDHQGEGPDQEKEQDHPRFASYVYQSVLLRFELLALCKFLTPINALQ